jgi:endonuclease-3
MNEVEGVFDVFYKNNQNPKIELYYINPYTLLVATVLSARATDVSVNKITKTLFNFVKEPIDMIEFGEERLRESVKTIGLYQNKSKNIIALSKILIESYNSVVPSNREALEALPGVGRKTANVVLNVAFNQPTIPVDTHVYRVSRRIGFSKEKSLIGVERDLGKIIPKKYNLFAHHWLILHGRYICKALNPQCKKCPISKYCNSYLKH